MNLGDSPAPAKVVKLPSSAFSAEGCVSATLPPTAATPRFQRAQASDRVRATSKGMAKGLE
jgi:hypothetical protein